MTVSRWLLIKQPFLARKIKRLKILIGLSVTW
jgi:hypothetical protein